MKKLVLIPLTLMAFCGSVFADSFDFSFSSKNWENASQYLTVINIYDLTHDDLNEILLGKHPEIVVEFSAQTILPISFFLKGDLIHLVENDESWKTIEVMQTFYARCVQQELILSTNLVEWKPLLAFLTGQASVSLSIKDGKPSVALGIEINKRS